MQRSPIVRLLMSQDRVNRLGLQLDAELAPLTTTAASTEATMTPDSRIAQLQDEMDREARSSLVVAWLELSGPNHSGDWE